MPESEFTSTSMLIFSLLISPSTSCLSATVNQPCGKFFLQSHFEIIGPLFFFLFLSLQTVFSFRTSHPFLPSSSARCVAFDCAQSGIAARSRTCALSRSAGVPRVPRKACVSPENGAAAVFPRGRRGGVPFSSSVKEKHRRT